MVSAGVAVCFFYYFFFNNTFEKDLYLLYMYFIILLGLEPILLQRKDVPPLWPQYMQIPPIMKSDLEKFRITFLKADTRLEQEKLKHTESAVCLRVGYMLRAADTHFHCGIGRYII